jgi:uncharacterized iron-regulated membrane protein
MIGRMRPLHRRLMTICFFTLLYWVISGLLMAVYDATDRHQSWAIEGAGPGARLLDDAATATALPPPAAWLDGVARARGALGARRVASADLRVTQGLVRLQFADASGNRNTIARFNALTGTSVTQLQAEGNPDGARPDFVRQRNLLKSWHRGDVLGLTGQALGFCTGLALLLLAVSGMLLYLKLWRARRRIGSGGGRGRFFWSAARESRWRRLHRWLALGSAVLVLNIAASGTLLAAAEIKLRLFLDHGIGSAPYPRPGPLPPSSAGALPANLGAMLATAWRAAQRTPGGAPVQVIQLVQRDGIAKALVTVAGTTPHTLAFDALTGTPVSDWATGGIQVGGGYYADWHQFVKRLHRGDIIGHFWGRYVDLATGLALLYLVISGGVMFLQTRRR